MPMFVSASERVPVTLDGSDTIYIKPKLDFGAANRVVSAVTKASATEGGDVSATLDMGAYNTALMINSIVGWEGPSFTDEAGKPLPCSQYNVLRLDPDEPLVKRVLEEIQARNQAKRTPDGTDPK